MAQIVGIFRLGRDAELRYTPNGEAVANLALAYNYGKKPQDGNKPSQWLDAAIWGKRAEAMAQYLTKGGLIYCVINDPHIETFQGKNGEGHKMVGTISEIEFAGGKSDGGGQRQQESQASDYQPAPQHSSQGAPPNKASFADLSGDIPFNCYAKGRVGHCM